MKKQLLLGAHMSVAGGYEQAIIKGDSIGCTAIQIFTKSSRQWSTKPITSHQALLFKEKLRNSQYVTSVMAHASYLINIASADKALANKSVLALIEELERCHALSIPFLVLHPGAAVKSTQEASVALVSERLNEVFDKENGTTMILLENTAGQGSSIGATFEQLHTIHNGVLNKHRVGFCFDTCHAFAAGYDFTTPSVYEALWKQFDECIGIKHLKAFHINDSAKAKGCRVDRHAHIGKGAIGLEAFSMLMNDARFFDMPKILETPKAVTSLELDIENLNALKQLLTPKTKKALHVDE